MKEAGKRNIFLGILLVVLFGVFTWLVQVVDVKPLGANGTDIGFSTINCWFHHLCGVHMTLYTITDWSGLVPVLIVFSFGVMGLVQLIRRKSLIKVDTDILILGVYYIVVATLYVVFEMIPINYRPILINGVMEVSYPSSTTLLVLGVMPTLAEQIYRRKKPGAIRTMVCVCTILFSVFMVVGRLLSGVHWLTDILGSVIISIALYDIYRGLVFVLHKNF